MNGNILLLTLVFMFLVACEARALVKRQFPLPIALPITLPIPDVLNLGVCRDTILPNTVLSGAQVLKRGVLPASQYLLTIKKVMDQVPYRPAPVSSSNVKTMSQLYRFGMFGALSYCENQNAMQNFAKISVNNDQLLYLGRFQMKVVRDVDANRYVIATDDEMKQIIVAWRGTDNINNVFADLDGALISGLPGQSYPLNGAKTGMPNNARFFQGFVASLSQNVFNSFDNDLKQVIKQNSGYQLIFAGHSLGGAQAVLAALHWHLTQQQPKITAVYTYGMPILGNTAANSWVADELQSYNWVRAVSRGDLAPWGRVSESAQFPNHLDEVYLPASQEPVTSPIICKGQMDARCSAGIPCSQKQWVDHVWLAGIAIMPQQFCVLGR